MLDPHLKLKDIYKIFSPPLKKSLYSLTSVSFNIVHVWCLYPDLLSVCLRLELPRIDHWRPPGSGPGLVHLSIGPDNASNGHEKAIENPHASALYPQSAVLHPEGSPIDLPEGCSRASHVFAERAHDSVRARPVLNYRNGS